MSKLFSLICALFIISAITFAADSPSTTPAKTRVLIFTGGHGFDKEQFFKLFKENPEISYEAVEHPNAYDSLKADAAKRWDVLVLYDMQQEIPEEAKQNFLARLKDGKGLVVLHHALCSYQHWPEYAKIVGGQYFLDKTVLEGVEHPASTYKHDVDFKIHVADAAHPVTRGISDYETHDETYFGFGVNSDCRPLLTTDETTSTKVIAWAKTYAASRVVYIQSGHDHRGYENPNFQRLLRQAIQWTAPKNR